MNIIRRVWPSSVERALLWQIALLVMLLGGLYLTGLLDNGDARHAAFMGYAFASGLQWFLLFASTPTTSTE